MGIVINQTIKNTIITYIGFAIGAINTLFLYTNFLSPTYYGVVGYLLSASTVLMPILAFGTQNTLIKFYSSYKDKNQRASFTAFVLFLPLLISIPAAIIGIFSYSWFVSLVAAKNKELEPFVWTIFVLAFFMAYFELFYAWAKVHFKSVYGNFLKEVYHRVVVAVLLILLSLEWVSVSTFMYLLMGVYGSRMLLMLFSAILLKKPTLIWKLPNDYSTVLKYSMLIILTGSIAAVLLDIDKVMLGQFKEIENIAYYNVAVFMAMVIAVPARAMHQITYPLSSELLNTKNMGALETLYKKSSINLFLVGGLIFLLIVLNVHSMYQLLPPNYSGGVVVVFLIGLAKLFDNVMGNNNAIIFNSDYYRMVLFFGVLLACLTVVLNVLLIPVWGINGAALATLIAFVIYNITKLYFVYTKLKIQPFTYRTFLSLMVMVLIFILFYAWDFEFHPILNIVLKSTLISALFLGIIFYLKLSEDINQVIRNILKVKIRR